MQCSNVENFGFNRCHTRKTNTSVIVVVCLMTLFSLYSSKRQLMSLLLMQCSNVESFGSTVPRHKETTRLSDMVVELITLFLLYFESHKIKAMKEETYFGP